MAFINVFLRATLRSECFGVLARLFSLMVMLFATGAATAQVPRAGSLEIQVKAAYLYKFGNYIEWPARVFSTADSPLVIGVMGADAMSDELARVVTGRAINGRSLVVHKVKRGDPVTGLHVLFIGKQLEGARLTDVVDAARGLALLTVTEVDDGLAIGSMINFVEVGGKLRFEIAPRTAGLGELVISARLLAAAHKVIGAPP